MPPKTAEEFTQAIIEAAKKGENVYDIYVRQNRSIILDVVNRARKEGKDPWTALAEDHLERTYRIGAAFQVEVDTLQEALNEALADLAKYHQADEVPVPDAREEDPGSGVSEPGVLLETEPAGRERRPEPVGVHQSGDEEGDEE